MDDPAAAPPATPAPGPRPDPGPGLPDVTTAVGLDAKLGLEILEATPERVVGRMPVEGNTQPYGLWHGGASCVLAETLGSYGSALTAGPGRIAVGIELNASHHAGTTAGWVTGVATRIRAGRTLATFDVVITDDRDRRLCTARLTCALRDA